MEHGYGTMFAESIRRELEKYVSDSDTERN